MVGMESSERKAANTGPLVGEQSRRLQVAKAGYVYPFSAIVGQERMKKALLLNAISPAIGGVLIRGEKGTAKSMAVRALASLLPEIEVVEGCPFACDPLDRDSLCEDCAVRLSSGEDLRSIRRPVAVVELPVGATEDRVVGTIDIEQAIKEGERRFEPGLLAAANRGILYIDEVNLLDDHLVDVFLDAAAMGVNHVEREGISFSHPARFILVGTMNPEEGDLRPQLLDRFGLAVEVRGLRDQEARMEVVRRRIAYESDPEGFIAFWEAEQEALRQRIVAAKGLLPQVSLSEDLLELISRICIDLAVDGHRADIAIYKTASTLAAYEGRREVSEEDVREAAELALLHRQRRQPFDQPHLEEERLEESVQRWRRDRGEQGENQSGPSEGDSGSASGDPEDGSEGGGQEQLFETGTPFPVRRIALPVRDEVRRQGAGRRSESKTGAKTGSYVGSVIPKGKATDLAFDATIRAAAPFQPRRRSDGAGETTLLIRSQDIREKVREKKVGNLILFVVDASGSMGAEQRMVATKGAILSLLMDAYQRRDRVGMVIFRGEGAELILPPTSSVELARRRLNELPTGGRTPLARGLQLGLQTIERELQRDRETIPLLVLVSDGRANVGLDGGDPVGDARQMARRAGAAHIGAIAIDTEREHVSFGLVRDICAELGGLYFKLEELQAGNLVHIVRDRQVTRG